MGRRWRLREGEREIERDIWGWEREREREMNVKFYSALPDKLFIVFFVFFLQENFIKALYLLTVL